MVAHIIRRATAARWRRTFTVALAAFVLLGAVGLSVAQTPSASAQTPFYPYSLYNYATFGYPLGGYNYLNPGYSYYGYNPYSYGYNGYGYNPYGYGYNSYYGYNPYSYGYNGYGSSFTPFYGNGYGNYGGGLVYAPSVVNTTSPNVTYVSGQRTYSTSGQYCTDKSGGQVWVPTGAPTSGLTCGGGSGQQPY